MTKIEPMTETQIKALLQPPHVLALQTKQLILAWIHAEASARKWSHLALCRKDNCADCIKSSQDWIAAIKREVGWPEDR